MKFTVKEVKKPSHVVVLEMTPEELAMIWKDTERSGSAASYDLWNEIDEALIATGRKKELTGK